MQQEVPRKGGQHAWRGAQFDSNYFKGILCTVVAAIIWVLASFVVQEVEDEGLSPFILSYIANSLFVVFLPIDYLRERGFFRWTTYSRLDEDSAALHESSAQPSIFLAEAVVQPRKKSWGYFDQEILNAALVVAPLWFLAQYTFNTSLHLTSVTSNTILSNSSALFTYGLSWALLQERFVAHKLVSILVCATGTSIVAMADSHDQQRPNSLGGDALCLVSGAFYACYTVAIKRMLGRDEDANTVLFFGYVGLINMVALAPLLLALGVVGAVDFAQLSARMLGLVAAKGLFDNALSDYLWARAVLLIGPTTATLGMSLQVPLAVALDLLLHRLKFTSTASGLLMLLGGWYVLVGFVGINVSPRPKDVPPPAVAIAVDEEAARL